MQVYDPEETDPGAALAQTAQGHIYPHHPHAPAVHTIADEERPGQSRKRVTFDEAQVRWACMQQFGGCLPGCRLQSCCLTWSCTSAQVIIKSIIISSGHHGADGSSAKQGHRWPAARLCIGSWLVLAVPPPAIVAWHCLACRLDSRLWKSECTVCCGCRCLQHLTLDSTGRETRARVPCLCNHPLGCL